MPRPLSAVPALGRSIAAAAAVGALGATTAVVIRVALDRGVHWIWRADELVAGLHAAPVWARIIAPAIGGLIAGLVVQLLIRRGSPGVADVMEAVALGRGRPRLGAAAAQAAGTVAAVTSGGSLGREGPLIQLGAGVGHEIAQRVTAVHLERRALVAAGTAAGFAAAYNTPLAAVLFVLEVVVGVITLDVVIPVAVATAVGTAITRLIVGGGPIYGVHGFEVASQWEFLAFAGVGIAGALAGVGFMSLLGAGERGFARLAKWPRPVRSALGGLAVGLVLWKLPEVAGNGYEPLHETIDGQFALSMVVVLCLAKAVATTLSVSSGSPGGVFTPTMVIGATMGAALGHAMVRLAPFGGAIDPGGYALVGMAATVAATTHAPLMATVMAFELSGDYPIVLPLLLATAVSTLLARRLAPDSVYTAELRRRGIPWDRSVPERLALLQRDREPDEP
ncbi:MAG TPA: chloride channel protein [Kofleriaceae bacterium]|nr:chloride channel protein [Kofleriaceae bacterium]